MKWPFMPGARKDPAMWPTVLYLQYLEIGGVYQSGGIQYAVLVVLIPVGTRTTVAVIYKINMPP
jgi:hypothetical protein